MPNTLINAFNNRRCVENAYAFDDNRPERTIVAGQNISLTEPVQSVLIEWWSRHQVQEIETAIFSLDANDKAIGLFPVVHSQSEPSPHCPLKIVSSAVQRHPGKFETLLHVDLARVASAVKTLSIASTVIPRPNATNFSNVEKLRVTITTANELISFEPRIERASESSLILINLYRKEREWKVRALAQGFKEGIAPLAQWYGIPNFSYDETSDPQSSIFEGVPDEYRLDVTPFAADKDGPDVHYQPSREGDGIAVDAWIEYVDASGKASRRLIYINKVFRNSSGGCGVNAFCTHRNAFRTFLLDRVKSFVDAGTGDVIGDVETYLFAAAAHSPRAQTETALEKLADPVMVLSFISRADGSFQKKEKEAIARFVVNQHPDASHSVVLKLLNPFSPSPADFRRSLNLVKNKIVLHRDVLSAVDELERTSKKIDAVKAQAISTVRTALL
ncbi:TerD family protein [Rhizobium sp. MHM7A]|uniref:TerD family protein n=1 Tax=Rhizobium sp. MHM7A TaxID=2583233 RepID=UPI001106633A|nr:TerD family protein [Rhizobium sp. MHM7A]TLX16039.1 TerD family protein [Rhizobium sp. MHM7A]